MIDRRKEEQILAHLYEIISLNGIEIDVNVLDDVVAKYVRKTWRGKKMIYLVACAFVEYLQKIGKTKYFLREIGEMAGVDWQKLIFYLRENRVEYRIDYDLRAREELGEKGYEYWNKLKNVVSCSPPVLMATIAWMLGQNTKVDVAAKFNVTDVSIRNCYRKIKLEAPEILEKMEVVE